MDNLAYEDKKMDKKVIDLIPAAGKMAGAGTTAPQNVAEVLRKNAVKDGMITMSAIRDVVRSVAPMNPEIEEKFFRYIKAAEKGDKKVITAILENTDGMSAEEKKEILETFCRHSSEQRSTDWKERTRHDVSCIVAAGGSVVATAFVLKMPAVMRQAVKKNALKIKLDKKKVDLAKYAMKKKVTPEEVRRIAKAVRLR